MKSGNEWILSETTHCTRLSVIDQGFLTGGMYRLIHANDLVDLAIVQSRWLHVKLDFCSTHP